MYGEPLQPNRTSFKIGVFDGSISIFVTDLDEQDNDDVREVVHPDFERFWDNDMENVFSTIHFQTIEEARDWCVSIGMTFEGIDEGDGTQVTNNVENNNKYASYSNADLKRELQRVIDDERFEEAIIIDAEIKKRNLQ